jgi:hypothetical protein
MDITELAKKPKLEELLIDDADIVTRYGESISFWIMDQMDVSTYFSFYKLQQSEDSESLNELLRKLILNKEGKACLKKDEVFPVDITLSILVKINEFLGKSSPKTSTPEIGEQLK